MTPQQHEMGRRKEDAAAAPAAEDEEESINSSANNVKQKDAEIVIPDHDDASFRIPLASTASQRLLINHNVRLAMPSPPLSTSLHVDHDGDVYSDASSIGAISMHGDEEEEEDGTTNRSDDDDDGFGHFNDIERFHHEDDDNEDDDVTSTSSRYDGNKKQTSMASSEDEDDPTRSSNRTTRNVTRIRMITFAVLLLSTIGISIVMYISSRNGELEQFELQFLDHAHVIVDSFATHWYRSITALDSFVLSLQDHGADQGGSVGDDLDSNDWPTKLIPNFASRAAGVRNIGRFIFFTILPKVLHEQRPSYEAFTRQNHLKWIPQGIKYEIATNQSEWRFGNLLGDGNSNDDDDDDRRRLQQDEGSATPTPPCDPTKLRVDVSPGIVSGIYTRDKCGPLYAANDTFYFPMWQHSPVDFAFVNYNIYDDREFGRAIQQAESTKTMVISKARFLNREVNTSSITKTIDAPSSTIYFPILTTTTTTVSATDETSNSTSDNTSTESSTTTTTTTTLRAMMSASIYWDAYMQVGDMPESADGIRIVLTNGEPCNQAYTFKVDGPDVVYVGEGDSHESKFNDYRESFDLSSQFRSSDILSFTGVKLSLDYCPYTIHVYPSQQVLDRYRTNIPIYYTVLVVGVLLFTSMVFVGYDCLVERRQRHVMNTAVKSQAIVSSLFPKNVRQRLMEDASATNSKSNGTKSRNNNGNNNNSSEHMDNFTIVSQKTRLKRYFMTNNNSGNHSTFLRSNKGKDELGASNRSATAPIADLFPNSTVLFADIAGFTAWSSVREPSQVFTLLESVYFAFDKIADRRHVFKVETIGDCYVAVTGLPDPQPDHAVIMSKFAGEILHKMTDITGQLELELGPDTTSLRIRIGIHSGPVTAGVLRGQKSRFQLFGDTVNTASRMESNGRPNFIQCSQETADLLTAARKGHWVKRREDIVKMKGKGEVQTFWVFPKGGMARRPSGTSLTSMLDLSQSSDNASMDDLSRIFASDKSTTSSGNGNRDDDGDIANSAGAGSDDDAGGNGNDTSTATAKQLPTTMFQRPTPDASGKNLQRLINWNVDMLSQLLKRMIVQRQILKDNENSAANAATKKPAMGFGAMAGKLASTANATVAAAGSSTSKAKRITPNAKGSVTYSNGIRRRRNQSVDQEFVNAASSAAAYNDVNPRNEYASCIHLPRFDQALSTPSQLETEDVTLPAAVSEQLRDYVSRVANAYQNDNPFHNFSHASHVTMSANKILNRVVSADDFVVESTSLNRVAAKLHDYTYGITSDPLTHFVCVFSALIHDVDHPGVSNAQLIKEHHDMALAYENKSVAEQNSVDLAWGLLMDTSFKDLRRALFADEADRKRFRQLLVNSVMATDIFDPELVKVRNERWEKAFRVVGNAAVTDASVASSDDKSIVSSGHARSMVGKIDDHDYDEEVADMRATIVIEHIIQAADVAHTMQHWHVYQKWNRRLFHEMMVAHKNGRMETDPSVGWYKGELWFYDNYVIPLARKLSECGVFGVSSDEFLNYATTNRREWQQKGEGIVEEMKRDFEIEMAS